MAELRSLGDAYYNAGRYAEAASNIALWRARRGWTLQARDGFAVAAAACQLKLKRLTAAEARALPDTADENGARRLDLLMELARDRDDTAEQQQIVAEMESRFPHSPWLAEALFSSGNMYLLKRDYSTAIEYYGDLAARFPGDKNAVGRALARRLAELPAGALRRRRANLRRADPALSRRHGNGLRALLARAAL